MNVAVTNIARAPKVNVPGVFPPPPRPREAAHVIKSDSEAIDIAHRLATRFAQDAALRDREGLLPIEELDAFSQSGLWGITIPKAYGGAGVSYVTLTKVIEIISAADPSLGQIPQNHLAIVEHVVADGSEAQKRFLLGEVLKGIRFGNAFSESGSKHVAAFETKLTPTDGGFRVNGKKFYSTGALLSHIVPIVCVNDEGLPHIAFADRDAEGLEIINDWSSFGQRTTASGSVVIDNVFVPSDRVVEAWRAFARPTAAGPISQIIQAAVDAGIARGTVEEAIGFVRGHARPWVDSGQERATDDQFTIAAVGDLKIRLHAAEAIVERAARLIDVALADANEDTVAAAAVATAEAKVLTTEIAILRGTASFRNPRSRIANELAGVFVVGFEGCGGIEVEGIVHGGMRVPVAGNATEVGHGRLDPARVDLRRRRRVLAGGWLPSDAVTKLDFACAAARCKVTLELPSVTDNVVPFSVAVVEPCT